MMNVMEGNFGKQLIKGLSADFDAQNQELLLKKKALETEILNTETLKYNEQEKLESLNDLIDDTSAIINVTDANLKQLMLRDDFDSEVDKFQSLRKQLKTHTAAKEEFEHNKNLLKRNIQKLDENLSDLYEKLQVINSQIPVNHYEAVLKMIEANEEVNEAFGKTSLALEVLASIDENLAIDVVANDDLSDFILAGLVFNGKRIKVMKSILRTDVQVWNSEVQSEDDMETPILNFNTAEEVRNTFLGVPKQDLFVETAIDIEGKRVIKNIFIKHPIPGGSFENYIKIGTKDLVEKYFYRSFGFSGLEIGFSEYPYSIE